MQFKKSKSADDIVSLLGKGTELTGEISFSNGLRVEGAIRGKVRSEAMLEIGSGGIVDAEVDVTKMAVEGEFRGIVHASDRVEIRKNGKVFGEIFSPCLIIEAGATFDGRCNMSEAKRESTPDPDPQNKPATPATGNLP